MAASKEAARLGKKVALLDFVVPTPLGTTWGLGGWCFGGLVFAKLIVSHRHLCQCWLYPQGVLHTKLADLMSGLSSFLFFQKLCHQASLLGEGMHDAKHYGWDVPEKVAHNW